MRRFSILVLHLLSEHPTASPEQVAEWLGISAHGLAEIVEELTSSSLLLPTENGWYISFAGRVALEECDVEREQRKLQRSREALTTICRALEVHPGEIRHFSPMALGRTNHSYRFTAGGKEYIYRMPGEGSGQLVNRQREHANYQLLAGRGIGDVVVYSNPESGVKISEYLQGCRVPDPSNRGEAALCMASLRQLHAARLAAPHTFSHRATIERYEALCQGEGIEFSPSHDRLRNRVFSLLDWLETTDAPRCFCHIDSVPGNFLLRPDGGVTLIDWEYAGEGDPLVDPAMWCLSAGVGPDRCDEMLQEYLQTAPTIQEQLRFYGWMAAGGFMWSLWAKYKATQGEEFGDYESSQLTYAEHYSRLFHLLHSGPDGKSPQPEKRLAVEMAMGLNSLPGARLVREEVFMAEQGYTLEFDETDPVAWHILLTEGGRPVATGRTFPQDGCWHIGRVAVRKPCRGRAIGKQVVAGLEGKIRQLGGGRVVLSAQLHAQKFYESMGYTPFGELVYDEGQPHIMMEKEV